MATKAVFGEYAAFVTNGGVRYMKNNKLTSEKAVPPEVVAYLNKNLEQPKPEEQKPQPQFKRPTPEESARLKAESLQVPPELQRTPEEMAAHTPDPVEETTPLTGDDFDTPDVASVGQVAALEEHIKQENEVSAVADQIQEHLDSGDPEFHRGFAEASEQASPQVDPDFLESVSIHTAPLQDIVEALYNRFGIYTVHLGKLPEADEINPLTGEGFTKYHLGIAYQASIYAQNKGILRRDPEGNRKAIDEGRTASAEFAVDPVPTTLGQARRENSFAYRTSPQGTQVQPRTEIVHERGADGELHAVQREIPEGETGQFNGAHARYDKDEDEVIVEPVMGGKPVIRPNW